ncbi:arginine/lysine/ornithine decarboxylase [Acetoanaerobium pronyense]|uniref:Arginine/lysine/ornithine decarboxylase n=1 Tax=Acetoanaerobium pronyense TaxID=1482736 RepID=A0ABS4KJF2_9FIRM|nr:aminotransferase class I/II-fold pyridoxal phosphate-dependent enzyme [Acetoanaerobium pronyense]MBP2027465.1 arginine/lysine/ornithine decarboxylase [Acetoanaerobium pronyense]
MKKNHDLLPLMDAIKEYDEKDVIPFDVPGHKHGKGTKELVDFFGERVMRIDVNSMKCLDNIGNPVSVIKEAQDLLADAYGADHAFFLTNGTSSGVQAMIMSACQAGDKVILPRNAHKSAINALILGGITPVYVQPEMDENLGIAMGVTLDKIREAIAINPEAKAVFLINPTYYGASSNLKAIVELCHKNDMAVLVDEAHGAHLHFHEELPMSAMEAGADMSAVSLHKTGGSLTQSSGLLLKEGIIDKNRVKTIINLTTSTSASYLLMASLDGARKILATRGREILCEKLELVRWARKEINAIDGMYAFSTELVDKEGVFSFDETKLGINVSKLGLTGFQAYDILRDEYNIQMELGDIYNVLGIVSLGDSKDAIEALVDALKDISLKYKKEEFKCDLLALENPEVVIIPRDAFYMEKKILPLTDSVGEISGEYIMAYPPGIPILSPGERITKSIIDYIEVLKTQKSVLTDNHDPSGEYIKVLKHNNVRSIAI